MSIWNKTPEIDQLNHSTQGTAVETMGIEFIEVGEDFLSARMPVDQRTKQPYGILHGGASMVLAETLGSMAAFCCLQKPNKQVVGLEINANHLRSVREGSVIGVARPIHIGGSTQVWEIRIQDDAARLICVSRITLAVIDSR